MLKIINFRKKYPGQQEPVLVVKSLMLNEGIYWIKGSNGAGKTTLFKSLAGLLPFEGSIAANDLDLYRQRMQYQQIVGYAEAEPLYPVFLSGQELIDLYTQTKGPAFPQHLYQALGVNKFVHQKTGTYSSGMLKKLSLVLAFTGNNSWILLDEPLIALDVEAVEVLQQTILEFRKKGCSFLITSHQHLSAAIMQQATTLQLCNQTIQECELQPS